MDVGQVISDCPIDRHHELDNRRHLNQMQAMRSCGAAHLYVTNLAKKDLIELKGSDQIDRPPFMNHLSYLSPIPDTV